jgi:hypothetical protein
MLVSILDEAVISVNPRVVDVAGEVFELQLCFKILEREMAGEMLADQRGQQEDP